MRVWEAWRPAALAGILLACSLVTVAGLDPNKVTTSMTRFDNLPSTLFYFEDSTTILYLDPVENKVYRSTNEGSTWERLAEMEDAKVNTLVEHPYKKEVAFALTPTREHYITKDRGKTWQTFTTPGPPSLPSRKLSFHATQPDWVLYTSAKCEDAQPGWPTICHDATYYTKNLFESEPKVLHDRTSQCIFAKGNNDFGWRGEQKDIDDSLVFCLAWQGDDASRIRLARSKDWFRDGQEDDMDFVDLGTEGESTGVIGIGLMQAFIVVAAKSSYSDEMSLYVSRDGKTFDRATFPLGSEMTKDAYTVLESTKHSLFVDVLRGGANAERLGAMFRSDSDGLSFVKILDDTHRLDRGVVDYERVASVEGAILANVIRNPEEVLAGSLPEVQTRISFDDGASWKSLNPPRKDDKGENIEVREGDSLHLYSASDPHNLGRIFSSPAPGVLMGVGNVGRKLLPYTSCDTFVSDDGGLTWSMVTRDAHKYEMGSRGTVLVVVDDEDETSAIKWSGDRGRTWYKTDLGVKIRAQALTTAPDSTSRVFLLIGRLSRDSDGGSSGKGRFAAIAIDFGKINSRACSDFKGADFEKWVARSGLGDDSKSQCVMGHRQTYLRRKADVDCMVGRKFEDDKAIEDDCSCSDNDFECAQGFARDPSNVNLCKPLGKIPIPVGECLKPTGSFKGSSGYRKIPGNTCKGGQSKDDLVTYQCKDVLIAPPGTVAHSMHDFKAKVLSYFYIAGTDHIIAHTSDESLWISNDQGGNWRREDFGAAGQDGAQKIQRVYQHTYDEKSIYAIGQSRKTFFSRDAGLTWSSFTTQLDANQLGLQILHFHRTHPDWLIFLGSVPSCSDFLSRDCNAVAFLSKNDGRTWTEIDRYTQSCMFAQSEKFDAPENLIICASLRDKSGSQIQPEENPLHLTSIADFKTRQVLVEDIINFAILEQYLVAAQLPSSGTSLRLQISLNAKDFVEAKLPAGFKVQPSAFTVLESTTDSIFLHVTTNNQPEAEWGTIFKSNSFGSIYTLSLSNVNRDALGYVDFEKMTGIDGIAIVNVVINTNDASRGDRKLLQSRITWNDGATWETLRAPSKDSLGRSFDCSGDDCSLHLHGYTERGDPRSTYSSGSAIGLMIGVGSVGTDLLPYEDSDTFLTRDGGHTWQEIRKNAHLWEFGDQGSIIVLVNDEEPTNEALYTLDEGLTWKTYTFAREPLRITSIATVPSDTSRQFVLLGYRPRSSATTIAVYLDFRSLTDKRCDSARDFEDWSPADARNEVCLFGRQTTYRRRRREAMCYIGEKKTLPVTSKNCACEAKDFECEFNHLRDEEGKCVLVPGTMPLETDPTCAAGDSYFYERTAYRKIPFSSCVDGTRPDRGKAHRCPGHGLLFWLFIVVLPAGVASYLAYHHFDLFPGASVGKIRLPPDAQDSLDQSRRGLSRLAAVASVGFGNASRWLSAKWTEFMDRLPPPPNAWSQQPNGYLNSGRTAYAANGRGYSGAYESVPRDSLDEDAAEVLLGDDEDEVR